LTNFFRNIRKSFLSLFGQKFDHFAAQFLTKLFFNNLHYFAPPFIFYLNAKNPENMRFSGFLIYLGYLDLLSHLLCYHFFPNPLFMRPPACVMVIDQTAAVFLDSGVYGGYAGKNWMGKLMRVCLRLVIDRSLAGLINH